MTQNCEWAEGCPNEAVEDFPVLTVNDKTTFLSLCSDHAAIYEVEVAVIDAPIR